MYLQQPDTHTAAVEAILRTLDRIGLEGEYRDGSRLDREFLRRLLQRESVQVILRHIERQLQQGASPEAVAQQTAETYGVFLRDAVSAVHAESLIEQEYDSVYNLLRRARARLQGTAVECAPSEQDSGDTGYVRREIPYPILPEDLPPHEAREARLYLAFLQQAAREFIDTAAKEALGLQLPITPKQTKTLVNEWTEAGYLKHCIEQNFPEFDYWYEEGAGFGFEITWRNATSLPWLALESERQWLYLCIPEKHSRLYEFSQSLYHLYCGFGLWKWYEVNDFALYGKPLPPRVGVRFLEDPYPDTQVPLLTVHILPFLSESTVASIYRKAAMREGAGNRLTALSLAMLTVEKRLERAEEPAYKVWNRLAPPEWRYEGKRASEMFSKTFRRVQKKWSAELFEPRHISRIII